jgi:hypothetical protein
MILWLSDLKLILSIELTQSQKGFPATNLYGNVQQLCALSINFNLIKPVPRAKELIDPRNETTLFSRRDQVIRKYYFQLRQYVNVKYNLKTKTPLSI